MKPTRTTRTWPCVFAQAYVRDTVDPWINDEWRGTIGGHPPFGDLRNMWRRHHCRTLNPYGSESCPYQPTDCARAFQEDVATVCMVRPRVPVGYFIKVAKSSAARRADEKPLTRDTVSRATLETQTQGSARPSDAGAPARGTGQGQPPVSGARSGPVSIGDLLGSLDLGPRPVDQRTRKESQE